MDEHEIEEAADVLRRLLAAVEADELEAPRRVVDEIRGALAALEALAVTAGTNQR